jgi:hypothetical protein
MDLPASWQSEFEELKNKHNLREAAKLLIGVSKSDSVAKHQLNSLRNNKAYGIRSEPVKKLSYFIFVEEIKAEKKCELGKYLQLTHPKEAVYLLVSACNAGDINAKEILNNIRKNPRYHSDKNNTIYFYLANSDREIDANKQEDQSELIINRITKEQDAVSKYIRDKKVREKSAIEKIKDINQMQADVNKSNPVAMIVMGIIESYKTPLFSSRKEKIISLVQSLQLFFQALKHGQYIAKYYIGALFMNQNEIPAFVRIGREIVKELSDFDSLEIICIECAFIDLHDVKSRHFSQEQLGELCNNFIFLMRERFSRLDETDYAFFGHLAQHSPDHQVRALAEPMFELAGLMGDLNYRTQAPLPSELGLSEIYSLFLAKQQERENTKLTEPGPPVAPAVKIQKRKKKKPRENSSNYITPVINALPVTPKVAPRCETELSQEEIFNQLVQHARAGDCHAKFSLGLFHHNARNFEKAKFYLGTCLQQARGDEDWAIMAQEILEKLGYDFKRQKIHQINFGVDPDAKYCHDGKNLSNPYLVAPLAVTEPTSIVASESEAFSVPTEIKFIVRNKYKSQFECLLSQQEQEAVHIKIKEQRERILKPLQGFEPFKVYKLRIAIDNINNGGRVIYWVDENKLLVYLLLIYKKNKKNNLEAKDKYDIVEYLNTINN